MADLVVTPAGGNSPHVEVFRIGAGGAYQMVESYIAAVPGVNFGSNGLSVSAATTTGNTHADIVLGDLVNGTVAVYDGTTTLLKNAFSGFEPGITNVGARVAAVDTTGSGVADTIVVASGPTPYPRIRRYDPAGNIKDAFFVYDPQFLGGIFVG